MSKNVEEHDEQANRDNLIYEMAHRNGMEKGIAIGLFVAVLIAALMTYLANL